MTLPAGDRIPVTVPAGAAADYRQWLAQHVVDTRYGHIWDMRPVPLRHRRRRGARRSAEIGCTLASFGLESVGTQQYTFAADDFASRVARTYGADPAADVRTFLAATRRTDQEETA